MKRGLFLSAKWEYLAMLNYVVDPAILEPHMPPGTVVDLWQGNALVSIVGFMFNDTRVLGIKWPLHTHFEEVNLRYYIKQEGQELKRGVGFVSEIVPRRIIATMANGLYNEHYRTMPMGHTHNLTGHEIEVSYKWKHNNKWDSLSVKALNKLQDIFPGSEEEFILEHYHGYNRLRPDTSIAYEVEHPRWQVFPVTGYKLDADVALLYGKEFVPFIKGVKPQSVFLARGSEINVRRPTRISKA
jgi:uncharacterized protein YqjF (DUF2071 family)